MARSNAPYPALKGGGDEAICSTVPIYVPSVTS